MTASSDLENAQRVLSELFGERDIRLQLVLDGVNKTLFGNTAAGDFFLRLSPESLHPRQQVEQEARLLAHVAEHYPLLGVRPFPEAELAAMVMPWDARPYVGLATTVAGGVPFDRSATRLGQFGRALARLHSLPLPPGWGMADRSTAFSQPRAGQRPLAHLISLVAGAVEEWADRNRPTTSGRRTIVHGDAWPGNARFSALGVTLFDFEHVTASDPVADVAKVAWWLTGLESPAETKAGLWRDFLAGYCGAGTAPPSFASLPYHVLVVELRALCFLQDFIRLSPDVEERVMADTQHMLDLWKDRFMSESGETASGW